jgi:hypothetical protein
MMDRAVKSDRYRGGFAMNVAFKSLVFSTVSLAVLFVAVDPAAATCDSLAGCRCRTPPSQLPNR